MNHCIFNPVGTALAFCNTIIQILRSLDETVYRRHARIRYAAGMSISFCTLRLLSSDVRLLMPFLITHQDTRRSLISALPCAEQSRRALLGPSSSSSLESRLTRTSPTNSERDPHEAAPNFIAAGSQALQKQQSSSSQSVGSQPQHKPHHHHHHHHNNHQHLRNLLHHHKHDQPSTPRSAFSSDGQQDSPFALDGCLQVRAELSEVAGMLLLVYCILIMETRGWGYVLQWKVPWFGMHSTDVLLVNFQQGPMSVSPSRRPGNTPLLGLCIRRARFILYRAVGLVAVLGCMGPACQCVGSIRATAARLVCSSVMSIELHYQLGICSVCCEVCREKGAALWICSMGKSNLNKLWHIWSNSALQATGKLCSHGES